MNKFKHKKSLGQHFLKDKNITRKIVELADLKPQDKVWEIGPGKGILTQEILNKGAELTCFEIDKNLISYLENEFDGKIKLINIDILDVDWEKFLPQNQIKIIANLPYQITSPFLFKVTENADRFSKIVVMIQKEVAQRIAAKPRSKDYGRLTLKMNYYFNVQYGFTVKPGVFYPKPKVDSAVILLSPRNDKPEITDLEKFWKLVKIAFSNRRKMLRRNLRQLLKKERIDKLSEICSIDLRRRAETLSETEFIELYNCIKKL